MNAIEIFDKNAVDYLIHNSWSNDVAAVTNYFFKHKITLETYLDLGSGPGTSSWQFLALGVRNILAIDSSAEMLKLFRETLIKEYSWRSDCNLSDLNIQTIQSDFITQPFNIDKNFDCIGAFGLFNYLPFKKMEKIISETSKNLNEDGYFCITIRLNREELSETSKEDWSGIWTGNDVYVHKLSSKNFGDQLNDAINVYYHSEKDFLSLLQANNLKIVCPYEETGVYITQKYVNL